MSIGLRVECMICNAEMEKVGEQECKVFNIRREVCPECAKRIRALIYPSTESGKDHAVKTNGTVLFKNFSSLNLVSHVLDSVEAKIILTEEWLNQPYIEPKEQI